MQNTWSSLEFEFHVMKISRGWRYFRTVLFENEGGFCAFKGLLLDLDDGRVLLYRRACWGFARPARRQALLPQTTACNDHYPPTPFRRN